MASRRGGGVCDAGSTGSTTNACSSRSATSHPLNTKRCTIAVRRLQSWWPEPRNRVSGQTGRFTIEDWISICTMEQQLSGMARINKLKQRVFMNMEVIMMPTIQYTVRLLQRNVRIVASISILLLIGLNGCSQLNAPETTPTAIIFTTTEVSFAPVIQVTGSPVILWTWADGTTSTSATPVKTYGTPGVRTNTLQVTPWSAVTRINIGYDGGDGGSGAIEAVADQHVSSVQGLQSVAPSLRQWCSSYNELTSLDFSNFTQLDTIECFRSQSLASVTLHNTPALQRACFEDCDLHSLDLSQSPNLCDLRGALNAYPTINFGTIGSHIWHICIRNNPQITNRQMFASMNQFPNIAELFIWDDNQTGALTVPATSTTRAVSILAAGNEYTSANFSGALQHSSLYGQIDLSNNRLTSLNITGCTQLVDLDASGNQLDSAAVDGILATLDGLGNSGGSVDLTLNTPPSAAGLTHVASLEGKGWTVKVDH
jgi:hypothetical protein